MLRWSHVNGFEQEAERAFGADEPDPGTLAEAMQNLRAPIVAFRYQLYLPSFLCGLNPKGEFRIAANA